MESQPAPKPNNKKSMLTALAVFVIPFAAALFLHKTGLWSSVGTSNRGHLISPPIPFESISLTDAEHSPVSAEAFKKKWWMVYVLPENCTDACSNSLYQMRQVHTALGPEQKRVSRLLITTSEVAPDIQNLIEKEFPNLTVVHADKAQLSDAFSQSDNAELSQQQSGRIYLVDTMGAVFMHYPTYEDEQESILKGRNLLKDLQKVLKLSKIG